MVRYAPFVTALVLFVLATRLGANAEAFKTAQQCVAGTRVADSAGKTGTVIRLRDGVMCDVKRDDTKQPYPYIFWMLHPAGQSAETNDKLVPGRYACYAGLPLQYTFMDVWITGATTYRTKAGAGSFRMDPVSKKIVFLNGPLVRDHGKLVAGPNLDLNSDGGAFYGTTCSLQKN